MGIFVWHRFTVNLRCVTTALVSDSDWILAWEVLALRRPYWPVARMERVARRACHPLTVELDNPHSASVVE
jgi:hypothetical protein